MTRIATILSFAILAACNPPEAKDSDQIWTSLQGEGPAAAAFEVVAGVDAEARGFENTIEVAIGGMWEDGKAVNMELVVLDGLESFGSSTMSSSEDMAEVTFTPDFESCDGLTFVEREDGGCDLSFMAAVVGQEAYGLIMNFRLRTQAPEGMETDGVRPEVFIEASELEAE